ncbi:stabilin-2-like [Aplochiton taeniatus]
MSCVCSDKGKCEEGIDGSGACSCQTGWQGDRCELKLGETPVCAPQCHPEAVCRVDRTCECQPPYTGDGLNCTAPDLCGEYNGGCHGNAICSQTGVAVNCSCQGGYRGDGFSCEPINRCLEETNGGCSDFATCTFTGPNQRGCECNQGYVGDGSRQCLKMVVPPIDRCRSNNGDCHPKAICKDLHFHTKTAGVFHLRSPQGKYQMNYSEALSACQGEGEEATLATFAQLADAQQLGLHLCVAGWLVDQKVGYPTSFPSVKCGDNHVGVVLYKEPVDTSSKYDAYCYRMQDVSCVCGSGSVGDGWVCNGDIASVVATTPVYSLFYKELLKYSDSSEEGQSLLDFLSTSSSYSTLFVPLNAGFALNQTLSGRDLEYHVTTNNSMHFYEDLKESGGVPSRLGLNLSVAVNNSQNSVTAKRVNTRLLLSWDIPASNGLLHVIEGPLRAPPLVRSLMVQPC